jgi:hypothetical protein
VSYVATIWHGDPSPASWRDFAFLIPYWASLILFGIAVLLGVLAVAAWVASVIRAVLANRMSG